MTLIELLIVIVIITTLVSAAIPLLAPTNDDRRLREASRAVNSFIAAAQARAISIQRPVGVGIKRLSKDTGKDDPSQSDNDNCVSVELYYVEQPSPFVGFNEQSQARVALYSPTNPSLYDGRKNLVIIQFVSPGSPNVSADRLPPGWVADQVSDGIIRPGDVIQIGGTRYQLLYDRNITDNAVPGRVDSNDFYRSNTGVLSSTNVVQIVAQPLNDSGQMLNVRYDNDGNELPAKSNNPPLRYWTEPSHYEILRQPMKTSAEPLQLPESSAIDLRASGVGDNDYFYVPAVHDNHEDILITFAPEGRVARLRYSLDPPDALEGLNLTTFDQPIVDNIYLLIGKRENCPPKPVSGSDRDRTLSSSDMSGKSDEEMKKLKLPVNWLRGESRWIVIGSQSGRVVTVENAYVDPRTLASNNSAIQSTEQLRNLQILAAREFVKEMKQLGGR
jgi:type II secretory pathway pseudopilin PulG